MFYKPPQNILNLLQKYIKRVKDLRGSCILLDLLFRVEHVKDIQGYIVIAFCSTVMVALRITRIFQGYTYNAYMSVTHITHQR